MSDGFSLDVHLQFGTCHLAKTFEAPMRRFCLFFHKLRTSMWILLTLVSSSSC